MSVGQASAGRRFLRVCGVLWASPNTLIGLLLGSIGLLFGARARYCGDALALVFHGWPWGPGGAMTLGNVILYTGDSLDVACLTYAHRAGLRKEPRVCLLDHERGHVLQYMALGPLFLPLYLACGGISAGNRFERAADRYAASGHGWWPWSAPGASPGASL